MKRIILLSLFLLIYSCTITSKHPKFEIRMDENIQFKEKVNSTGEISKIENRFSKVEIIDKISIRVPKELKRMSKKLIEEKYQENVRPLVAYSNKDVSAIISFSSMPQTVNEQQLPEFLTLMEQQFQSVYPQIKWIAKKMIKVEEKSFIKFEFISHKSIKDVYSLLYMTVIDENLFIITFSCTLEQQNKWDSLAKESMNSIREIKMKN